MGKMERASPLLNARAKEARPLGIVLQALVCAVSSLPQLVQPPSIKIIRTFKTHLTHQSTLQPQHSLTRSKNALMTFVPLDLTLRPSTLMGLQPQLKLQMPISVWTVFKLQVVLVRVHQSFVGPTQDSTVSLSDILAFSISPLIFTLDVSFHLQQPCLVYVDVGQAAGGTATLAFTFATSASTTRQWEIRVSQIECFSSSRPSSGCLQYFTTLSGTFKTFNYDAATTRQHLANQE